MDTWGALQPAGETAVDLAASSVIALDSAHSHRIDEVDRNGPAPCNARHGGRTSRMRFRVFCNSGLRLVDDHCRVRGFRESDNRTRLQ